MRACLMIFLLGISCTACAQTSNSRAVSKETRPTFTSPDGTFQFSYPALLVRCQLRQQGTGDGYYWVQPECTSYHPVCGDIPTPKDPIVCLAYPHDRHTDSAAFEAASFSVEETDSSENECLSKEIRKGKIAEIGGVKFHFVEEADGGMNQSRYGRGYVTYHKNKCYALGITVATAAAEVFDPPARKLTKEDWAAVNGALEQARDSFRFLK